MSLLSLDNNLRMNNNVSYNSNSQHIKSDRATKDRYRWSNSPTAPKTPSNLVKSTKLPSFSSHSQLSGKSEVVVYDRQKLLEFLNERETSLFKTRDEYDEQFENFFSLAKRFHTEKLNNLKLTFKNQILKQQIYFETELLELSKECMRDYECSGESKSNRRMFSSKKSHKSDKFEKEKQMVKLFKSDMKKLLEYMREALINSSDTLIEAYETCHILKTLETIENNFQKQNLNMKQTTSNLLKNSENNNHDQINSIKNKDEDKELTELNKQLSEEQVLFDNYKEEMDELMHTLDDIELQHLQRKDQLTTKAKFFNKLKNKFKFIETKYDKLNKQCSDLKYESYLFKKLHTEKQHISSSNNNNNNVQNCDSNLESNLYTKSSVLSSLSTTLSTSSSSRSSSTSSLSDCVGDITSNEISTTNEINLSESSSTKSSSSSSSSLSNEDISELMTENSENLEEFEELIDSFDPENKTDCDTELPNLSFSDYNRKLCLINDLIDLHKSKMSTKDLLSMSSESELSSTQQHPSLNNFTKANIKYFNLKNEEESDSKLQGLGQVNSIICKRLDQLCSSIDKNLVLYNVKQDSSLNLADVSTDGDRVCIENCNLKSNCDVSDWYITRQIDNMSINKYKFPLGSVIRPGKCLKIKSPFPNDQLDYLFAIKNQQSRKFEYHSSDLKKSFLKIKTQLIAPDGTLKAVNTQDIPQFYQEIFKYANIIKFL